MENKNKYNNSKKKQTIGSHSSLYERAKQSGRPDGKNGFGNSKQGSNSSQSRNRVLSLTQLLSRIRKQRGQSNFEKNLNSSPLSPENKGKKFLVSQREGKGKPTETFLSGMAIDNAGSSVKNNDQNQKGRNFTVGATSMGKQFGQKDSIGLVQNSSFNPNLSTVGRGAQTRVEREDQKRQKPIKPIIPPKSLVIILKEKPEKILYNRRIIDYKHCGLLQRYIGLGGKILPRRQTRLTAKQQRYIAKTIKSARIMGLLPFVSKEKGYFR